ncbi:CDP-glucose 4,6-dehydratase [Polynucleobacter sp. AP-Feld-500C-C5]|uniref:CDP-glucose 4,6-dehydratase n=1 Tax=Polynucleobacter sp. AP-Feld-500C-C5 TaxID=2576924 RepID=UPI001C0B90D9|nr:CDP-glucose 4,6-dehydratase [Polynucleobacter sp. AP-Feld-500C-C5]MBU3632894.1 CDP-glucose 4,6-dehydratase [Polynucleobacter sp. AP-Feld-500C-C5]
MHEFWLGKKVFITGHTGFKGSWLSLWLQNLGAEITGFALASPTNPSLFNLAKVESGMASIVGDVRDLGSLKRELICSNADIVFHMAAQPLVRESYNNPVETYSTNVMGTVNLFEAIRSCSSVAAVINITTDKCYENREWIWGYREDDTLGGHDPYSNSKACSELITSAFRKSFFNSSGIDGQKVAVASARAGNVIGGGDWSKDRLIPDIIRALVSGERVTIRNPSSIRPWQHVLDSLSGYLILAQRLYEFGDAYAEAWNFGPSPEDAKNVAWVAERLVNIWGGGSILNANNIVQQHEASYLKLDTTKSQNRLNWRAQLSLEEALSLVVDWSKKLHEEDVRKTTINQINQYQSLLNM